MDTHHLESIAFEMGYMGEAQKLYYVVRKHILSNGHLCLPNIRTNKKPDKSIEVGGKKHHFGLRHGNKEPKYGLLDIYITIQVLIASCLLLGPPGSNWCFSFAPELVGYSAPRDLHRRAAYSICESLFLIHQDVYHDLFVCS